MPPQAQHPRGLVPIRSLAAMLQGCCGGARRALEALSRDGADVPERMRACREAVDAFCRHFGAEASVFVARSTGRVNLLGMHVDHRGGFVNPIAVKDAFFVVEPRDDDQVHICNADGEAFPPASFRVSDELPARKIEDWDGWCHEKLAERRRLGGAGEWANYVKSAVLYLQHVHTRQDGRFEPVLRGMNMAVKGTIPMAAGLSSSSAVVVGAMEACVAVNALPMTPMEMVEACRLAEWYVGTRGGGGDHAAIKFGRKGHVLHVGSFPFSVEAIPFPQGYTVVLADSRVQAKKQEGARDAFNQRVACYEFGLLMLRRAFPAHADAMVRLRDVNPQTLGVSEAQVYGMLRCLPERCSRDEIREALRADRERVERTFRTHAEPPEGYAIRQVCVYGVTECIRSALAGELLRRGDVQGLGELINISHEGDRVSVPTNGGRAPNDNSIPDAKLDRLIADAESQDPQRRERARLWRQPGGYDVSTEEQDILVDIARRVPGVVGAGLVGAGLGGCVIALVTQEAADAVISAMTRGYYEPRGLPVAAEVVEPVDGSGIVEIASA